MANFELSNLTSQPFWLITFGLALAGWIVSIVGSAMAQTEAFTYWTLVYIFLVTVAMFFAVATNSVYRYRLGLLAFSAVGFSFAMIYANSGLFAISGEAKAAGAGFVVLSIVLGLWLLILGIDNNPLVKPPTRRSSSNSSQNQPPMTGRSMVGGGQGPILPVSVPSSVSTTPMSTVKSSDVPMNVAPQPITVTVGQRTVTADPGRIEVSQDVKYEYKGMSLYAYTASPDDPNELSFGKGELLDIVDNKGKWWQARKADGSIGIVPSNYIKLL